MKHHKLSFTSVGSGFTCKHRTNLEKTCQEQALKVIYPLSSLKLSSTFVSKAKFLYFHLSRLLPYTQTLG